MDDLPLELKQRVCSYLSPKDLKSFRSTAKFYAAATDRYLVPRIFLSNHPVSFQEIQEITNHPEMRHAVTTLVVDTSCLPLYPKYEQWARRFADAGQKSDDKVFARAERVMRREKNHEKWKKYQERAQAQRGSKKPMLDSIALAFQRCPKLSNLIIECYGQHKDYRHTRPGSLKHDIHPLAANDWRHEHKGFLEPMRLNIWDMLKPVHDIDRALSSLILLDMTISCPHDWELPTTTIFQNLKHLRHLGTSSKFLSHIIAHAPELESIGILGSINCWRPCRLQPLFGKPVLQHLRAFSLDCLAPDEDEVVHFLLRHSSTLQDLRIMGEQYRGTLDWSSFATRVQGRLPNLRRVEINSSKHHTPHWTAGHGWVAAPPITGADLLQDHGHDLETGPRKIEDGLWEDFENLFFPDKGRS